ncbi:MAG TPA: hypothetical protein VIK31_14890, partial [Propionibacteriaceae bacterium]
MTSPTRSPGPPPHIASASTSRHKNFLSRGLPGQEKQDLASYKGIPVVGLILIGLVLIYTFVTQRTVLGRHIYAVGGNSNAARLSGVDTRRVSFFVMVNMGLLAGVAGMVFTAYLNAANPKDGTGFELDAIAAVFVGGAAVAGGVGKVSGAMIGGFVMGVLNLGLANLSV